MILILLIVVKSPITPRSSLCISIMSYALIQAEHEGTDGQYEINYEFADALTAADRHTFFKFLVKVGYDRRNT